MTINDKNTTEIYNDKSIDLKKISINDDIDNQIQKELRGNKKNKKDVKEVKEVVKKVPTLDEIEYDGTLKTQVDQQNLEIDSENLQKDSENLQNETVDLENEPVDLENDKTNIQLKSVKKLHIILDLDQTLISAEANEDHDFEKYIKKSKSFDFEDMDGYYIVFSRPGLQPFLDHIFENYTVSVWTAASKDYAIFIIEKIILKNPKRKLNFIFFSYHCDLSHIHKKSSKDLTMLWDIYGLDEFNKDNTVILDDYLEVYKTQPDNCLIAVPFEFTKENSENDTFLTDLIPELEIMKSKIENGSSVNTNDTNKKLAENILIKAQKTKNHGKALSRKRNK